VATDGQTDGVAVSISPAAFHD